MGGSVRVAVVDGMGGGIGAEIVAQMRKLLPQNLEVIALGTNSIATARMVKAGANRGASGENAIIFSVNQADIVVGPIGIVIPNSMMGEVTPAIANSIVNSPALKIVLPIEQPHLVIVGPEPGPLSQQIERAIEMIRQRCETST